MSGGGNEQEIAEEAFRRIYSEDRDTLLKRFRCDKGRSNLSSTTLTEQKEFAYWLFKYRVRQCEKAKIASDTRKALDYLQKQRARKRFWGALVTDEPSID